MNRWAIKRRDLLKSLGLGVAALPMLQAAQPAKAQATAVRRLIMVVHTNGLPLNCFQGLSPTSDLSAVSLPPLLAPLDSHKQDLIVFPELGNPAYEGAGHGAFGTTFSPGPNNPAPEYWTPQVPTLDQIAGQAAKQMAPNLQAVSLPLQVQQDSSESRLGAYRCFFSGNDQAVTPETDPYKLSDRLFANKPMGDPVMDRLRAEERSMLDFVGKDLERFARNLGTDDKDAIFAHLQSIRNIETQLSGVSSSAGCVAPMLGDRIDLKANDSYPALLKLDLDLAMAALRCDYTRVVTLVLGNAFGGNVTFSWLGIEGAGLNYATRSWHDVAHVEMNGTVNDKLAVDTWYMTQLAYLIEGMKATPEGDSTLFDNSVILWANHMETGGGHNARKLPWICAGSGGGVLKTGQFIKPAEQVQKTQVMCELANLMGANVPYLGSADYGSPFPEMRA